jgi:hypothetical protein
MRFPVVTLAALIVAVAAIPALAAGPQVGPSNGPLAQPRFEPQGHGTPAAPNPFGTLFPPTTSSDFSQTRPLPKRPLTAPTFTFNLPGRLANLSRPEPRVVCGLVIIPVDPHLDPDFVHEIPKDALKWTMKVLPAPPCEVNR